MSDSVSIAAAQATGFLARLFAGAGLSPPAAREMATALVDADRAGLPSHGLSQAEMYLRRLMLGSISTAEEPVVVATQSATAVLDAQRMFGHLAGKRAMLMAIERARAFGAGVVAVRNSFHFGAAGRYAQLASDHDCVGIAMCNTKPMMPAPGGASRVVGNNPVAIGMPAADGPDFLLDMALSEAALGKIRSAETQGRPIPEGWAVDKNGAPTTSATAAIEGMLLPTGGAKGFGLALAVNLMSSLLAQGPGGADVPPLYGDLSKPFECSLLFIAIDIAHFGDPHEFRAAATGELGRIRDSASTGGRLRTPGQRGHELRRHADTVRVPRAVAGALDRLAGELHLTERLLG